MSDKDNGIYRIGGNSLPSGGHSTNNHRNDSNSYIERGISVKRGSKLDHAIRQYKEKGYYTTEIGNGHYSEWKKEPPKYRPVLYGNTFHQKNYNHPLEPARREPQ